MCLWFGRYGILVISKIEVISKEIPVRFITYATYLKLKICKQLIVVLRTIIIYKFITKLDWHSIIKIKNVIKENIIGKKYLYKWFIEGPVHYTGTKLVLYYNPFFLCYLLYQINTNFRKTKLVPRI